MRPHDELLHYGVKGMTWGKKKKKEEGVTVDLNKLANDFNKALSSPAAKYILAVPLADAMASSKSSWNKAIKRSRYINKTIKRPNLTGYRVD
jgi:hypothetical protein